LPCKNADPGIPEVDAKERLRPKRKKNNKE
jgi:hypothetical protein